MQHCLCAHKSTNSVAICCLTYFHYPFFSLNAQNYSLFAKYQNVAILNLSLCAAPNFKRTSSKKRHYSLHSNRLATYHTIRTGTAAGG